MNGVLKTNIIFSLGLDELPVGERADLVIKMADIIGKRIALRAMKLLTEDDLKEYLGLTGIDSEKFLIRKIPHYASLIEAEIVQFKREIVSRTSPVK